MAVVPVRGTFLLVLGTVLAACAGPGPTTTPAAPTGGVLTTQDPAAPVLVQGILLDETGAPMPDHPVTVVAVPDVFATTTQTDGAGRFVVRHGPTAALVAEAAKNGSWVNFELKASGGPSAESAVQAFTRSIAGAGTGWADQPETIQLQLGGD